VSEVERVKSRLWGPEDVASYLGVKVGWVYDRTRQGGPELIPHLRLGKYLKFDLNSAAFEAWLMSHQVGGVDTEATSE
jgi:hypothetical protein